MKRKFDIKYRPQIESGEYKVETREGLRVEILKWDVRRTKIPILAIIEDLDVISYHIDGTTGLNIEMPSDLFIITPEQELTEFETHLQTLLIACGQVGNIDSYKDTNAIKETAKNLLEYAKAELRKEFDDETQEAYKSAIEEQYKKGYRKGVESALYNIEQIVEGSNFVQFPRDTYKKLSDMIEKLKNEK